MGVSVHTAPQWCGSCQEHHPIDWLGRYPFGTSYIPRPGRVHVVCMPTRTPPVHTTAPTSAYPGHYPRPWLLGRSLPKATGSPPLPRFQNRACAFPFTRLLSGAALVKSTIQPTGLGDALSALHTYL